MDAKGIGYGLAMDAQGIGYGCKRDRLWMRKGEARDAACRFIDSQIHIFTFSHKNMCSAFRHNIYNMIIVI